MKVDTSVGAILIADPDRRTRAAVARLLTDVGYAPVELSSGEAALERAREERPRLVILEVSLPGICGYEVCRRLRAEYGESVSILIISGTRTESFDRVAGILLGADDCLGKPLVHDEFLARVGRLMLRRAQPAPAPKLTPREHDVLDLLAQGLKQKEIADRLVISGKTVGTHTEHIFAKLGARSRVQAVEAAHRRELL